MRILFVTWDGPGQSYLETLYFPIFARIRERCVAAQFDVFQLSWGPNIELERRAEAAAAAGMGFYHMGVVAPSTAHGTMLSTLTGAARLLGVATRTETDVVLARSLVPAALTLLARTALPRWRWCFDADGFMADERRERASGSASGIEYRVLRKVEQRALRSASTTVTRTAGARTRLLERAGAGFESERITVVPNGRDETVFAPTVPEERRRVRLRYGIDERAPWLVVVGSYGQHYLPDETLALFAAVRRLSPTARFLWATSAPEDVSELLRRRGVEGAWAERLTGGNVPSVLGAATVGVALRRRSPSQEAVSPLKLGEYLLCGLPVVTSRGIGDVDSQLSATSAVRLLDELTPAALEGAARWIVELERSGSPALRQVARTQGLKLFSLDRCAKGYYRALERAYLDAGRL